MIGARDPDGTIHYPVSEVAARHGASAVRPADSGSDAYPEAGWTRDYTPEKLPWPPS